jgi:hypothetical protein
MVDQITERVGRAWRGSGQFAVPDPCDQISQPLSPWLKIHDVHDDEDYPRARNSSPSHETAAQTGSAPADELPARENDAGSAVAAVPLTAHHAWAGAEPRFRHAMLGPVPHITAGGVAAFTRMAM